MRKHTKSFILKFFITLSIGTFFVNSPSVNAQSSKSKIANKTISNSITQVQKPLDGAFIQFWGERREKVWQQVMDAMKAAKMRTIVLQYLQNSIYEQKDINGCAIMETPVSFTYTDSYKKDGDNYIDPTEFILQYAEKNGMEVYIGLANDQRFVDFGQWDNPQCIQLNERAKENKDFAKLLWTRYQTNPLTKKEYKSFAGWYLPFEMWNQKYTDEQIKEFQKFFADVSQSIKKLKNKPVLASPYINFSTPAFLDAKGFASMYGNFLKNGDNSAGIDFVLLQDSVGAKFLTEDEISVKVDPYYKELKSMCLTKGCKLWANVESYEGDPREPTTFTRLKKQLEVAGQNITSSSNEQIITFEFFHYMNPFGNLHENYADKEKTLYCEYLSNFFPDLKLTVNINCPKPEIKTVK